jgi:hypothetical protein
MQVRLFFQVEKPSCAPWLPDCLSFSQEGLDLSLALWTLGRSSLFYRIISFFVFIGWIEGYISFYLFVF